MCTHSTKITFVLFEKKREDSLLDGVDEVEKTFKHV